MGLFDLAKNAIKNAVIEKLTPQPKEKTLEEQRIENLTKIAENVHKYFLEQSEYEISKAYTNNQNSCTISMKRELFIPNHIKMPNEELKSAIYDALEITLNKIDLRADVDFSELYYGEIYVEIKWRES